MGDENWRRNTVITLVLVMGIATITSILAAVMLSMGSYTTSWGEKIRRNERYLTIEDQTFTQEDLEHVAGLRHLRSLELKNCNIAECRLPELTFASKDLYSLSFEGTGLWDTSFLGDVKVEELDLTDCKGVESIANLSWDTLDELHVDGTAVSDLSPVKGSELWELTFSRTEVADVSPLATAERLDRVNGSYTKVRSIDALAGMDGLYEMRFDGCPIEDIQGPFASTYLRIISLANTNVRDLSAFSACERISELNLGGCRRIKDMSWMNPQVKEGLTNLNLAQTKIPVDELGWIASCKKLEKLTLDGIELEDLSICRELQNLTCLSAVNCGLTDVSDIKHFTTLESLLLGYNNIQDLADIPYPVTDYPTMELDLSHNQLTSLADLPKGAYRLLLLQGNDPEVIQTMPAEVESYVVAATWFEGVETSPLKDFAQFSHVYLLDCPPEKVQTLTSIFYEHRLGRVSEEQLLELLATNDLEYWMDTDFSWYATYVRDNLLAKEASE